MLSEFTALIWVRQTRGTRQFLAINLMGLCLWLAHFGIFLLTTFSSLPVYCFRLSCGILKWLFLGGQTNLGWRNTWSPKAQRRSRKICENFLCSYYGITQSEVWCQNMPQSASAVYHRPASALSWTLRKHTVFTGHCRYSRNSLVRDWYFEAATFILGKEVRSENLIFLGNVF